MYFNNISENKKFLLLLYLSFTLFPLLIHSIVSYTDYIQYSLVYALEDKNTLEDKKPIQNNNGSNTSVYKAEEIYKLSVVAKEYYLSGDYPKAITYLDKILVIDANNTGALTGKGIALKDLGQPQDAITYFDKALDNSPNDLRIISNKRTNIG